MTIKPDDIRHALEAVEYFVKRSLAKREIEAKIQEANRFADKCAYDLKKKRGILSKSQEATDKNNS